MPTDSAPLIPPTTNTALAPAAPVAVVKKTDSFMDADEQRLAGGVIGATAGALIFPVHPVLGILGGFTIGSSAPMVLDKDTRTNGLCRIGTAGAALTGAVMWKRHPVLGYILGTVAGFAVSSRFDGEQRGLYEKLHGMVK